MRRQLLAVSIGLTIVLSAWGVTWLELEKTRTLLHHQAVQLHEAQAQLEVNRKQLAVASKDMQTIRAELARPAAGTLAEQVKRLNDEVYQIAHLLDGLNTQMIHK